MPEQISGKYTLASMGNVIGVQISNYPIEGKQFELFCYPPANTFSPEVKYSDLKDTRVAV